MGDNLTVVDLGSDFQIKLVSAGSAYTMVVSTNGTAKAFGYAGRLGYEESEHIGDEPGEMGDNLTRVNLGTGFNVTDISDGCCSTHTCVFDRHFELLSHLKCWGLNGASLCNMSRKLLHYSNKLHSMQTSSMNPWNHQLI